MHNCVLICLIFYGFYSDDSAFYIYLNHLDIVAVTIWTPFQIEEHPFEPDEESIWLPHSVGAVNIFRVR